jgi:hypothetical protein
MELHQAPELYERVIHQDDEKLIQVRLTISEFRGVEYLSIRKYYMDFEEDWRPSPEGISIPLDLNNSKELFIGLVEILSLAEAKDTIEEHFRDLVNTIYQA